MSSTTNALRTGLHAVTVLAAGALWPSGPAQAQGATDPFVGEIRMLPYTFCPRGWANAEGQLLAIADNNALFSLYGTIYGGDGRTTFGLPDLRGRVNIGDGQGPGLSNYEIGQRGGVETVTLTVNEMPAHTHGVRGVTGASDLTSPENAHLSHGTDSQGAEVSAYSTATPDASMHAGTIANTGGNQPHDNMAPFFVGRWCVALFGIYPSRN